MNIPQKLLPHMAGCVVVAFSVGCQPTYEAIDYTYDDTRSDLENLQGEWVCVSATSSGEPDPGLVGRAYEFQENKIRMKARPKNNEWVEAGFLIEDLDNLKLIKINMAPVGSVSMNQIQSVLYRFADGALELCEGEMNKVPFEFESTKENGNSLRTFKRVK